jgi:hypothetical protein
MPIDPLSLCLETTIGLELKLVSKLKFKDVWLIHKFEKHIKNNQSSNFLLNEHLLDDITDIRSRIIMAINNSDEKEKNAWIGLLLSKMDQIGLIERFGLCYTLEELIINYSKHPNFVENDIFMIYAWFCKYYNAWETKYPQEYPENEFLVFKEMADIEYSIKNCRLFDNEPNLKRKFHDPSFLAAWNCAQMLYRCSLNIAELSRENLIRVGNHLSHFSAGERVSTFSFRKNVIFDMIYLEIIIQIAAKAKSMQIEPMHSKLKIIILQTNPERLNEAFKTLDGTCENKVAKLGKIDVFLATPTEIQNFKNEIMSENSSLKNSFIG